jgi:hypothetical protein
LLKIGAILLLGLFLIPLGDTAMGAYVIRLKNGNEFVTSRYWLEGRQILFDTYGGVFGVDKAFVTKIEASNKPMTPLAAIIEEPELKRQSSFIKNEPEPKQQPPASTQEKNERNRADDPIFKEFDSLKEKFEGLEGMLTSELQDFSTDLMNLKRKIQTSGKSNDYLREFTAIFEMGDALEEILKARR